MSAPFAKFIKFLSGDASTDRLQQNAKAAIDSVTENTNLRNVASRQSYGAAIPTGPATVGDVQWNTAPAGPSSLGWVCTASGNPGTWVQFGSAGGAGGTLYGAYGSRPAAGTSGRLYIPSDGPVSFVDTGSKWLPLLPNAGTPGSEVAAGNANPFSLTNGGGGSNATIATFGGCVSFKYDNTQGAAGGSGSGHVIQVEEVALTSGKGPQAFLNLACFDISLAGVYVRDSASGKILALCYESHGTAQGAGTNWYSPGIRVTQFSNMTTKNADVFGEWDTTGPSTPIGMRLRNDGTNYQAEVCTDGTNWINLYHQAKAVWVPSAGDKCGLLLDPYSGSCSITCLAWDQI